MIHIKQKWKENLHEFREKEFNKIFNRFPHKVFPKILELGSGDGFQSKKLTLYAKKVIATDYLLEEQKNEPNVQRIQCDAENITKKFKKKEFDLIYSSNMMEHLQNPEKSVTESLQVLKDDGIIIHVMPNTLWKIFQLLFFHINLVIVGIEALLNNNIKTQIKKQKNITKKTENNPKRVKKYSLLRKIIWPIPHGEYPTNISELFMYRKKRWIHLFNKEANVLQVIKGPISTGYGFGCRPLKKLLEKIGLCTEYIYIIQKKHTESKYKKYFKP